jgi:hypothetical protein
MEQTVEQTLEQTVEHTVEQTVEQTMGQTVEDVQQLGRSSSMMSSKIRSAGQGAAA